MTEMERLQVENQQLQEDFARMEALVQRGINGLKVRRQELEVMTVRAETAEARIVLLNGFVQLVREMRYGQKAQEMFKRHEWDVPKLETEVDEAILGMLNSGLSADEVTQERGE